MSFIRKATTGYHKRYAISGSGDPFNIPTNGSLSTYTSAGVVVDENTMLSLLAVTACIRIISETVSGLPFDAVKYNGKVKQSIEPCPQVIADPFGGMNVFNGFGISRKNGIGQVVVSLLMRGNAFLNIVEFDAYGVPTMVQVLSPDAVTVDVDNKTGERLYKVNNRPFPANRMVHIVGMSMPGSPVGLSPLSYAKRSIALGIAAEEFGSMFFGNGAHMSGVIEVPGDLDYDAARTVKESFESKHSGMRHAHAVGVLTGGAKFAPISVSPEDAQFIATRAMQTSEIAMLFGIPPHMLGQVDRTTSWGKGIEEQTLGFLKYTLQGWVQRIEDAFTAMLPDDQQARFNLDGLLRADTNTRFAAYQLARNSAIYTPNEIRGFEDMPPVEGGDDLFAPLNSAHTTDPGWKPGDPEPEEPTDPNAPEGKPEGEDKK